MKTRIKVSTEIERGLTSVKPGDVVISLEHDVILIVVKTNADGSTFDGLVLDSEEEINHWERDTVIGRISRQICSNRSSAR